MNNISDIKKIYTMFSGLNIDTLEIQSPEGSVLLTFGDDKIIEKEQALDIPTAITEEANKPVAKTLDILSPNIGIFHRSNPKTGEYYVKLRDVVKGGQIVGYVEVLGVNYDIISHEYGKIIDILVENEQPIEYGQPIIRLEAVDEA